jgi:hypothetical protein
MHSRKVNRRDFLVVSGALAAGTLLGCYRGDDPQAGPGATVYRLSARGKRASQASKKHNANMLFANAEAADRNRAHVGDHSRIVQISISRNEFRRFFGDGRTVVDLRKV